MQNSFNPFGLRMALTSPADIEGEKVDTYEAKSVKERLQRAKAKKRGSKQKGK